MKQIKNMSCGERAVRCLTGEPVDRVPFGVGLGWCPWGSTLERWRQESGDPNLDPARFFGYEDSFAIPEIRLGIHPPFEHVVLEETAEFSVYRDGRGITMRQRHDHGSIPEFLDYPVKNRQDWEHLKAERLRSDSPDRVPQDWAAFQRRLAATGEAVRVGCFPYGVFGTVRDLMGVEATLLAFYDDPEMIHDMMQHLTTLWISVWSQVAREVPIAHIHLWEDMSGRQGSLISPSMVEEFMMPCYDRIAAFARKIGVRITLYRAVQPFRGRTVLIEVAEGKAVTDEPVVRAGFTNLVKGTQRFGMFFETKRKDIP